MGLTESEAIQQGYLPTVSETSIKVRQTRVYKDSGTGSITYVVLHYPFGEEGVDHRDNVARVLILKAPLVPRLEGTIECYNMGSMLFVRSAEVEL